MVREFFQDPVLKKLFLLALVIRLVMLMLFWGQPLAIVDEQHYDAIANHLVTQGQYLGVGGTTTAIRPPLYPFFLSLLYGVFGHGGQDAARFIQTILSLGAGVLFFALCRTIISVRSTRIAVGFFLLYPSLLFFNCLILTEILFTFLFLATLTCIARVLQVPSLRTMALAGFCLGLATLTRSITYPMAVPLALLLLLLLNPLRWRSWASIALLMVLFLGTLSPWIARNYKVFHAFIPVDTMGGLNLYMGNYEHTPLHRAWAAVDITDDKAWYRGHEQELQGKNEAEKQKWGIAKGLAFMREHPGLTALRIVIKAANFWGMDRALIAGMKDNYFYSFQATPVKLGAAALILAGYGIVMLLGFSGLAGRLLLTRSSLDIVVAFIICYFTAMHALVFGHSRYHLPLIPLLCLYTGWTLEHGEKMWATQPRAAKVIVSCVVLVFISIWIYEVGIGSKAELSRLLPR